MLIFVEDWILNSTKVYSRSIDPQKLRVSVKYDIVLLASEASLPNGTNIIGERERANLVVRLARFFYIYNYCRAGASQPSRTTGTIFLYI